MLRRIVIFVVVSLAVSGIMKYIHKKDMREKFALAMAKSANSGTPVMVDESTRLDGVYANGPEVDYNYTLLNVDSGQSVDPSIQQRLHSIVKSRVCQKMQPVLTRGVSMAFHYVDSGGHEVIKFTISENDCAG